MPMRTTLAAAALCAALILLAAGAVAADGQQPEPTDPVAVVESFLLARDMRDAWGAAIGAPPS